LAIVEHYSSGTTADLANNLGNLLNRALNMTHQYRKGKLKRLIDNPFPGFEKAKNLLGAVCERIWPVG